jgi:hypothetical protein
MATSRIQTISMRYVQRRKALEGDAEALLTKPIDFVALRSEIDSHVAGAGAEVR